MWKLWSYLNVYCIDLYLICTCCWFYLRLSKLFQKFYSFLYLAIAFPGNAFTFLNIMFFTKAIRFFSTGTSSFTLLGTLLILVRTIHVPLMTNSIFLYFLESNCFRAALECFSSSSTSFLSPSE